MGEVKVVVKLQHKRGWDVWKRRNLYEEVIDRRFKQEKIQFDLIEASVLLYIFIKWKILVMVQLSAEWDCNHRLNETKPDDGDRNGHGKPYNTFDSNPKILSSNLIVEEV